MTAAVQKLQADTAEIVPAATKSPTPDPLDSMPWLPCTVSLEIAVVGFTIGDLLTLRKGSVVESATHHTSDVPLRVNKLLIGWTEIDVVGDRMAARITEQA